MMLANVHSDSRHVWAKDAAAALSHAAVRLSQSQFQSVKSSFLCLVDTIEKKSFCTVKLNCHKSLRFVLEKALFFKYVKMNPLICHTRGFKVQFLLHQSHTFYLNRVSTSSGYIKCVSSPQTQSISVTPTFHQGFYWLTCFPLNFRRKMC